MFSRDFATFAALTAFIVKMTVAASVNLDSSDYELVSDDKGQSSEGRESVDNLEVRCYCNQPECVPESYMCRGRSCFTELPSFDVNPSLLRPEHSSSYSGCLKEDFRERQCPAGLLCCSQDLCNHVDSPALRLRLNKTLQVLMGDQRAYLDSQEELGQSAQSSTDGWFKTATIAVPICGLIALLILASLAIRLLQPVPTQADKLGGFHAPENTPPLLAPSKVPLV